MNLRQYFFQRGETDCGCACLKTMYVYYKKVSIIFDFPKKTENLSLYSLKEIAEKNGMKIKGVYVRNFLFSSFPPSILLLKNEAKNHYVFFLKKRGKSVLFFDPYFGMRKMKEEEFKKRILPYALLFTSFLFLKERKKYSWKKEILLDIFLQIFFFVPLFILFFFFSNDQYFPYFLLLACFLLKEVERFFSYIRMFRFDKKIEKTIEERKKLDEKEIEQLYRFKKARFTYISELFFAFSIRVFYFLLCLQFSFGLLWLFFYLIFLLIKRKTDFIDKEKEIEIEMYEQKKEDLFKKYRTLNQMTKKYFLQKERNRFLIFLFLIPLHFLQYFLFSSSFFASVPLLFFFLFLTMRNDRRTLEKLWKDYQIGTEIMYGSENREK